MRFRMRAVLLYLSIACAPCSSEPTHQTATAWLKRNSIPSDVPNEATYFDGGIATTTISLSLQARTEFPWAKSVPLRVWYDAVLPFAVVNEARTDWRQMLWSKLAGFVKAHTNSSTTLAEAATIVNDHMWALLSLSNSSIAFRSEQTPLIYDPMSTMAFGYASCTGISLLYVAALRTLGIPARPPATALINALMN